VLAIHAQGSRSQPAGEYVGALYGILSQAGTAIYAAAPHPDRIENNSWEGYALPDPPTG